MPPRTAAVRRHSGTNGVRNHNADFLKQVADREAAQVSKRPAPLSVEQHAAHRKQLDGVRFFKPKYAKETEINVAGIFGKWKRYCEQMNVGPWMETIKSLKCSTMQDFFFWVCEWHRIKSWGTSLQYIRQFGQLHTTVTGRYLDRNHAKELYKYHDTVLLTRFDLQAPNSNGKPVLNVDSLRVILVFNIAYDTGIQPLERQRIQLSGCYMIICYTGVRPAELINNERKVPKNGSVQELFDAKAVMAPRNDDEANDDEANDAEASDPDSKRISELLLRETVRQNRVKALCYEDILMMVVRHPVTGRPIVAMSIKFIHHKGCDNKPNPIIFFFTLFRKLIFCLILLFVAFALSEHAFDAECLTDARSVFEAKVLFGMHCVPLRWKKSFLKIPFFRKVARDGILSKDEAMMYAMLRD